MLLILSDRSTLCAKRNEDTFQDIFQKATEMVEALEIEQIQMPRQRKPPAQFTSGTRYHNPKSPEEYYRAEYYKMLDCVDVQFGEKFNQPDLQVVQMLEETLLTGVVSDIVDNYPELVKDSLKVHLAIFHSKYIYKSRAEVAKIIREMTPEVRGLVEQVETLVRLRLKEVLVHSGG